MRFFILVLTIASSTLLATPKWERVVSEGGVQVYRMEDRKTGLIRYKGTALIKTTTSKLVGAVLDYERFKEWQPNLMKVKRLNKFDPYHAIVYYAFDLPWPVKNRDVIINSKVIIDKKNKWMHVKWHNIKNPLVPVSEDFIRVPFSSGKWSLKPVHNGKHTWVEFVSMGNPGGWIPKWLVNWIAKSQIMAGVNRVRKRLKQNKYSEKIRKEYSFLDSW